MRLIQETLAHIFMGQPVMFRNMTLFPLHRGARQEPPDYVTLDEALSGGFARVTEISESGSVPELRFQNEGVRRVFLLDGEELVGAKQNRVLNLSILAPPRSELKIPVSCVEQGRWHRQSAAMSTVARTQFASSRAGKMASVTRSMTLSGARRSDQAAVWHDIQRKSQQLKTTSSTSAMADLYRQHDATLSDYARAFPGLPDQVGALFAIGERLVGLDLFDSAETLHKLLPKLLRGYALDALDAPPSPRSPSHHAARAFGQLVMEAQARTFPAVGLGEDVRLTAQGLAGAALVEGGRVVHLGALATT